MAKVNVSSLIFICHLIVRHFLPENVAAKWKKTEKN